MKAVDPKNLGRERVTRLDLVRLQEEDIKVRKQDLVVFIKLVLKVGKCHSKEGYLKEVLLP
jgi:hypothetical protein